MVGLGTFFTVMWYGWPSHSTAFIVLLSVCVILIGPELMDFERLELWTYVKRKDSG